MASSGALENDQITRSVGASDSASRGPDTTESSQEPRASETPMMTSRDQTPQASQATESMPPAYSYSNTWNIVTGFVSSTVSSKAPGKASPNRKKNHPNKLAASEEPDGGATVYTLIKKDDDNGNPEVDGSRDTEEEKQSVPGGTWTQRTRKAQQKPQTEAVQKTWKLRSSDSKPGFVFVIPGEEARSAAGAEKPAKQRCKVGFLDMHWCDICDECFPTLEEMEAHLITHFNDSDEDFDCEECGEFFQSASELDKHRCGKHGKLRYCCDICGIQYNYQSQFVIHMRTHSGERPYTCDACGQEFGHKCSLVIHQRKHAGSTPHQCRKCDKMFDTRSALHKHEKLRYCSRCHKCYTHRSFSKHLIKNCIPP